MAKDGYGKAWIIENGVPIVHDFGTITLRELHYQLVGKGMPNTINHYKRVISSMTEARWNGLVDFSQFEDHERDLIGRTEYNSTTLVDEIDRAIRQIGAWMTAYHLERWSNQPNYVETWVEKKALIGVFQPPCSSRCVSLFPCKGYPSLTWLWKAKERFEEAQEDGKQIVIIYFGDYDPSGDDIPRSVYDNLVNMGVDDLYFSDLEGNLYEHDMKICLTEEQVKAWGLPPAPTKLTDTRSKRWTGIGQVELDAVSREKMRSMITDAIDNHFDDNLYKELQDRESEERLKYQQAVQAWVKAYGTEDDEEEEDD